MAVLIQLKNNGSTGQTTLPSASGIEHGEVYLDTVNGEINFVNENQNAWHTISPVNFSSEITVAGGIGNAGSEVVMQDSLRVISSKTFTSPIIVSSTIFASGSVLSVSGNFHTVGNITATGSITPGSSRDYKENILELDESAAYEAIMALEPVSFNYKEAKEQIHLGFIAEDVPGLVAMNDRKSLSTLDITAALTKVVQKQEKDMSMLREEIEELKNLIQNSGVNQ
jgi:hypothetical protein